MKVVFGGVFISLIYGAPETSRAQLENGPAAARLCDTQEQGKHGRMDPGYNVFLKD